MGRNRYHSLFSFYQKICRHQNNLIYCNRRYIYKFKKVAPCKPSSLVFTRQQTQQKCIQATRSNKLYSYLSLDYKAYHQLYKATFTPKAERKIYSLLTDMSEKITLFTKWDFDGIDTTMWLNWKYVYIVCLRIS